MIPLTATWPSLIVQLLALILAARISDTSAPTVLPVMATAGRTRQTMKRPVPTCQNLRRLVLFLVLRRFALDARNPRPVHDGGANPNAAGENGGRHVSQRQRRLQHGAAEPAVSESRRFDGCRLRQRSGCC